MTCPIQEPCAMGMKISLIRNTWYVIYHESLYIKDLNILNGINLASQNFVKKLMGEKGPKVNERKKGQNLIAFHAPFI